MGKINKVILFGTTLVVAIGCSVYASNGKIASKHFKFRNESDFKAKFSDSQEIGTFETSGDILRSRKERSKNLTEEEKLEIKEKKEAKKERQKQKFDDMADEEKTEIIKRRSFKKGPHPIKERSTDKNKS